MLEATAINVNSQFKNHNLGQNNNRRYQFRPLTLSPTLPKDRKNSNLLSLSLHKGRTHTYTHRLSTARALIHLRLHMHTHKCRSDLQLQARTSSGCHGNQYGWQHRPATQHGDYGVIDYQGGDRLMDAGISAFPKCTS